MNSFVAPPATVGIAAPFRVVGSGRTEGQLAAPAPLDASFAAFHQAFQNATGWELAWNPPPLAAGTRSFPASGNSRPHHHDWLRIIDLSAELPYGVRPVGRVYAENVVLRLNQLLSALLQSKDATTDPPATVCDRLADAAPRSQAATEHIVSARNTTPSEEKKRPSGRQGNATPYPSQLSSQLCQLHNVALGQWLGDVSRPTCDAVWHARADGSIVVFGVELTTETYHLASASRAAFFSASLSGADPEAVPGIVSQTLAHALPFDNRLHYSLVQLQPLTGSIRVIGNKAFHILLGGTEVEQSSTVACLPWMRGQPLLMVRPGSHGQGPDSTPNADGARWCELATQVVSTIEPQAWLAGIAKKTVEAIPAIRTPPELCLVAKRM